MSGYKPNQFIDTPNGPGMYVGKLYDQGHQYDIVKHNTDQMTGFREGQDLTPQNEHIKLVAYEWSK